MCTVQHSLQKVIVALLLFCHKPFCDVWNSRSSSRRQNQTFYIFYNLIKFAISYKVHQKQIKAEGKIKTNLHFMFSYFVYICWLFLANRALFLLPFFRKWEVLPSNIKKSIDRVFRYIWVSIYTKVVLLYIYLLFWEEKSTFNLKPRN